MKFSDCLSAMVEGKVAVKGDVRRRAIVLNGIHVEQFNGYDGEWAQKPFKNLDLDEEGWEIEFADKEICGITFTRRPDDARAEVWVSDERGLRLTRNPGCAWLCQTCRIGPKLVISGKTAEEAVMRVLQEAEEVARMVAQVLGTTEASK